MPLLLLSLFSVWIWFSPNPLAHESWLAAFFNTDGLQMTSSYPVIMWLSILLTVSGLFFSFSLFKKGTPYATHYGKEMRAFPLLENGFFVNKGYEKIGTSLLKVSRVTNWVDTKVMDGCLHLLGVGMVVLSKIVALVDRFVVDGPVNAIAYVSAFLGKILARLSSKYIQTQLVWLIVAIILILIWLYSS
jgi:NADH-quinone oxidoreductase subunit L